jgi:uncharacterized membrane protein YphA (DoxX/SURF4 family)
MSRNLLATLARVAFGLLFVLASLDKIAHPDAFARIVYNYQILPEVLVNPLAVLLPWLELVCGAALTLGVLPRGAAAILCGLLAVFLGAFLFNLHRGLDVYCGCFSTTPARGGPTGLYLARDAAMLVLGLAVLRSSLRRGR